MGSVLYELRSAYNPFGGGVLNVGDGRSFNVAAALDAGAGTITVDDTDVILIDALDHYAPLVRTGTVDTPGPPVYRLEPLRVRRTGAPTEGKYPRSTDTGGWEESAISQADVTGLPAALAGKQSTSSKNQPNGYAGLGSDGIVPSSLLPPGNTQPIPGVVGDGVADDTAALQAVLATGANVLSPAGKTYLISSQLVLATSGQQLDLGASTIKKAPGMTADAVRVTSGKTGVVIRNGTLDGNRSGGATGGGIRCDGTAELRDFAVLSCGANGVWTGNNAADLVCRNVTSKDNRNVGGTNGFLASSGKLRCYSCHAEGNDSFGYSLSTGAAAGCAIDGTSYGNGSGSAGGGAIIKSQGGRIGRFYCEAENRYGLVAYSAADWSVGDVQCKNIQGTSAATGVELFGCTRWQVGRFAVLNATGYGVAISYDGATSTRSSYLSIDRVDVDSADDPALHFSGAAVGTAGTGAHHCEVGALRARNATLALILGEGSRDNDYNTVGSIDAISCTFAVVMIDGGSYNRIGRVIAQDCGTTSPYRGLVTFDTANGFPVADNEVAYLESTGTGAETTTSSAPQATVYADAGTTNNRVLDGVQRHARRSPIDLGTGNDFRLRERVRQTTLAKFDVSETWGNGASDSLAWSRFREVSGGKKFASATGGNVSTTTLAAPLDLSALPATTPIRVALNAENASDRHATDALRIRLQTDASNYFERVLPPGDFAEDGLGYHTALLGDFTAVGAPSWSNITMVGVRARSAAAGTFVAHLKDLVALKRHDFAAIKPAGRQAVSRAARDVRPSDVGDLLDLFAAAECETFPLQFATSTAAQNSGSTLGALARSRSAQTYTLMRTYFSVAPSSLTDLRIAVADLDGAILICSANLSGASFSTGAPTLLPLGGSLALAENQVVRLLYAAYGTTSPVAGTVRGLAFGTSGMAAARSGRPALAALQAGYTGGALGAFAASASSAGVPHLELI